MNSTQKKLSDIAGCQTMPPARLKTLKKDMLTLPLALIDSLSTDLVKDSLLRIEVREIILDQLFKKILVFNDR